MITDPKREPVKSPRQSQERGSSPLSSPAAGIGEGGNTGKATNSSAKETPSLIDTQTTAQLSPISWYMEMVFGPTGLS